LAAVCLIYIAISHIMTCIGVAQHIQDTELNNALAKAAISAIVQVDDEEDDNNNSDDSTDTLPGRIPPPSSPQTTDTELFEIVDRITDTLK
jgi:hypothetical protein